MSASEQQILQALRTIVYPGYSRDIVSLGVARDPRVEGGTVSIRLTPGAGDPAVAQEIERRVREVIGGLAGVERVQIDRGGPAASSPSLPLVGQPRKPSPAASGGLDASLIPGVGQTIAVASGKGGVGKSTVAVNLATALARSGARVGLLDADIYGPSIPLMFGLQGAQPTLDSQTRRLIPFERCGVRLMSLGFLVDPQSAVIWRGPMVMKAIEQLLAEVDWGELDVLVVDLPPGTGDAQLTLAQKVRLSGVVIVTTPQDVALADAIKGVAMFRKVGVPVLGLVENMSYFLCPNCNERSEIFGHGGGREQAARLGVPFLGEVPLDATIRASGDAGRPVAAEPEQSMRLADRVESAAAAAFGEVAARVREALAREPNAAAPGQGIFDRFRKVWDGPPDG